MATNRSFASRVVNGVLYPLGLELRRIRKPKPKNDDFDEEAFLNREKFRTDYRLIVEALVHHLYFHSCLDIGSANGFFIDEMVHYGKDINGIELSEDVVPVLSENARERTIIGDGTEIRLNKKFDLVICVEVAEHIPPERSENLVDTIACHANEWVFFTAATPFQAGRGHINCRPHFFWMSLFRDKGFSLQYEMTKDFKQAINHLPVCTWIPLNTLIFRHEENSDSSKG